MNRVVSYMAFGAFTRPVQGELRLEDDRVTFTATQRVGKRSARKLEEISGRAGVAAALVEGQSETVLAIPVSEIDSWKVQSLGSQLQLKVAGRRHVFAFYDARKAQAIQTASLKGVGRAKDWDKVLAEAAERAR